MRISVLGVDPGKTSGVCLVSWSGDKNENPRLIYSQEVLPEDFAFSVLEGLSNWSAFSNGGFKVACERFLITAQTVRNSQAPFSLEQIGVLKHLCRENNYQEKDILFQAPSDAKNMFPNKTLQDLGIWHRGGGGHANDAIRHSLLALVRSKWVPYSILK